MWKIVFILLIALLVNSVPRIVWAIHERSASVAIFEGEVDLIEEHMTEKKIDDILFFFCTLYCLDTITYPFINHFLTVSNIPSSTGEKLFLACHCNHAPPCVI